MCGFAGFACTDLIEDPAKIAELMGERIAHRGPDDADEISFGLVERDVLKRLLGLRTIGERDIVDVDDRFHGYLS